MRSFAKWLAVLTLTVLPGSASCAESPASHPAMSAHDLVEAVVANELEPHADPSHWMYEAEKEKDGKKQTKEVVQTRNGPVDRLLTTDGHPLSPEQQQEEMDKIKTLSGNRQEQQKWQQVQKKDAEETESFMKMIPGAFVFTYAGQESGLVKLVFRPNPSYQFQSREARVLHAMEGEMLVQADEKRLASISGHLVEEVKFGGGWLGHLEKGGTFSVRRCEVSPKEWVLTAMEVDIKGKALFLKTVSVHQKEYRSDFRKVPNSLTLGEAAELLVNDMVLAANRHQ